MECSHSNTYFSRDGWPTGEAIEVCKDCGLSRSHWEQGESSWQDVDIKVERKEIKKLMDSMKLKPSPPKDKG